MNALKHALAVYLLSAVIPCVFVTVDAQMCTWDGASETVPPTVTFLRSERSPAGLPGRIATDAQSRVYTTDPRAGVVVVRDGDGRLVSQKEDLARPLAIAVDAAGMIYVGEMETGSVTVFDELWNPVGSLGQGEGEFLLPNDIAIDPDEGSIFVSDGTAHQVKVYSPAGELLSSLGGKGSGAGQLDFPAAVWVNAAGELFVADQNNDRVQVFDRNGDFLRCFGSSDGNASSRLFGRILGLTGDSSGRIYVADAFHGEVKVFEDRGLLLTTIGSFGEGPGELRTPQGLAFDSNNRLLVASPNNARIEVFGIDDYSDPHVVGVAVDVWPSVLNRLRRGSRFVVALIGMPGPQLASADLGSIRANGVPAEDRATTVADFDGDGAMELKVRFAAGPVLETVPDGVASLRIEGSFLDGTFFEGVDTVLIVSETRRERRDAPGERGTGEQR